MGSWDKGQGAPPCDTSDVPLVAPQPGAQYAAGRPKRQSRRWSCVSEYCGILHNSEKLRYVRQLFKMIVPARWPHHISRMARCATTSVSQHS